MYERQVRTCVAIFCVLEHITHDKVKVRDHSIMVRFLASIHRLTISTLNKRMQLHALCAIQHVYDRVSTTLANHTLSTCSTHSPNFSCMLCVHLHAGSTNHNMAKSLMSRLYLKIIMITAKLSSEWLSQPTRANTTRCRRLYE